MKIATTGLYLPSSFINMNPFIVLNLRKQLHLKIEIPVSLESTHYHTMPHFDALKIYSFGKHCETRAANCRKIRPSYPKL